MQPAGTPVAGQGLREVTIIIPFVGSYFVQNFGCRATQADGAELERQFASRGLNAAENARAADVVVLNTCTVTASADRDARAAIRRVHRENPAARIVVTGCYAQRAPEELAALPGVAQVIGNSHKHQLAELAAPNAFVPLQSLGTSNIHVSDIFAHTELLAAPVFEAPTEGTTHAERTRPNLKIQDGCDNRCSFCVIPFVRGQSRSLPAERVLREVNALVGLGYREVVLSGINLGRWGRELARPERFEDLVRAILAQTSLEKLRLSSIEPMDWSDELLALVADSPRIARHVHAPLQSGSDRILRAMHRKYRPWHYSERITRARAAMPDAAIGADVMVGFPGETEALFEESHAFIAALPFTYLHVFTYSARPGTPAAAQPGQVPEPVKRERNRMLRELASAKNRAFRASFAGRELEAITLSRGGAGCTEALTDNYLKLQLAGEHAPNQWLRVRVTGLTDDGLLARML
jgi:threonylcarbamoyladenosine tRNA methylthiotransferase MtaB